MRALLNSILVASTILAVGGCSSITGKKSTSAEELTRTGPAVVNVRMTPDKVQMNDEMQPNKPVEVYAEVKDFNANVSDVRLKFVEVPFEVKMQNISGTTWKATLNPDLLRRLTVGGQTTTYNARIYAESENGNIGVSQDPVKVAVVGPDLSKKSG